MQNFAKIGLGADANDLAGSAFTPNDRLGPVNIQIENIQPENAPAAGNAAYVVIKQLTGSGWANLVSGFSVAAGGRVNKEVKVFTKKIGFFGSGNTTVTISVQHAHGSALRGGQIDVEATGRRGYGYDTGVDGAVNHPGLVGGTPIGSL